MRSSEWRKVNDRNRDTPYERDPAAWLIVEDDPLVRQVLASALSGAGYVVRAELDGAGVERAVAGLRSPDGSGRPASCRSCFITGAHAIEDVLSAFEAEGHDYVIKPFAMAELLVRMKAVLRRWGRVERSVLTAGDLAIDLEAQRAVRNGAIIELTHREFFLLATLARHFGIVLSKVQLLTQVWASSITTSISSRSTSPPCAASWRNTGNESSIPSAVWATCFAPTLQYTRPPGWGVDVVVEKAPAGLSARHSASVNGFGSDPVLVATHLARVEALEAKVAELEQTNRHLTAVAADVAHDLRSPLQATQGMQELVETLLEHRRSSSVFLDVTRFDCNEVATAVTLRLGRDLEEAGTRVVIEDLPFLRADRVQVGRVLQNLVANAIRATSRGRKPVKIAGRRLARAWELSVTDDGVGVPDADRDRIFEMFERGPDASGTGKGMGLAICRAIVERHGGRIGVERTPGGGSRFSFTLPDTLPAGATRSGIRSHR